MRTRDAGSRRSIHRLPAEHWRAGLCWWPMPKQKTPAERLAALQEQMKAAKDDLKAAERKRCEIVGAAVVSLLQSDADFKAGGSPETAGRYKEPSRQSGYRNPAGMTP